LAWRLESGEWERVASGIAAVRLQTARAKEARLPGHEFVQDDVTQIKTVIRIVDQARHALADVSGEGPSSDDKLKEVLARGASC
jgi:hypothetical protein